MDYYHGRTLVTYQGPDGTKTVNLEGVARVDTAWVDTTMGVLYIGSNYVMWRDQDGVSTYVPHARVYSTRFTPADRQEDSP